MKNAIGKAWLAVVATAWVVAIGCTLLAEAQTAMPSPRRLNAMKADYKRPPPRPAEKQALVDLGRHLFYDPRISASGKTSCASCHYSYLGWGTAEPRSRNDSGKLTSRRSQPLVGIGHAIGPIGWDGRSATLEAQVKSSITTGSMSMRDTDTPVKVEVIEERIRAIPEYVTMFNAGLPGEPITIASIATAIAAYERAIEPGIAAFDLWINGDEDAISQSAKRGFVLFNDRAGCFLCHSGWRFTNDSFQDIGTTTTDKGRGRELETEQVMQYAFKTPTLRSVALRPPFMHNGSVRDLYEVMKHYERGGIDRPSRSPLMKPIALTDQERLDLIAFMQTLTGMPEAEAPPKLPGAPR